MSCVAILYGLWFPFDWAAPRATLAEALHASLQYRVSRADALANVLLGAPLGFFLTLHLARGAARRAGVRWAGASAVSACVVFAIGEGGQLYLPGRVPAWSDLACGTAGALLGSVCAAILWRRLAPRSLASLVPALTPRDPFGRACLGLVGVWVTARAFPYSPTLDPGSLWRSFKPLLQGGLHLERALFHAAAVLALGRLIVLVQRGGSGGSRERTREGLDSAGAADRAGLARAAAPGSAPSVRWWQGPVVTAALLALGLVGAQVLLQGRALSQANAGGALLGLVLLFAGGWRSSWFALGLLATAFAWDQGLVRFDGFAPAIEATWARVGIPGGPSGPVAREGFDFALEAVFVLGALIALTADATRVGAAFALWVPVAAAAWVVAQASEGVGSADIAPLLAAVFLWLWVGAAWQRSRRWLSGTPSRDATPAERDAEPEEAAPRARTAAFPTRSHMVRLAASSAIVAVYASLVPFGLESTDVASALERIARSRSWRLGVGHRADWVAHVVLFVPLGFLWMGAVCLDRARGAWRWLLAMPVWLGVSAFGVGAELAQIWVPARGATLQDAAANVLGSALGVALWLLAGPPTVAHLRALASGGAFLATARRALQVYAVGLLFYLLMPLDLAWSAEALQRKWEAGRIQLVPFASAHASLGAFLLSTLSELALFVPIGALCRIGPGARLRPWPHAIARVIAFAAAIEVGQVFVYTRYADLTDVLALTVGGALGAALLGLWFRLGLMRARWSALSPRRRFAIALATCAAYALVPAAVLWHPYEFDFDPASLSRGVQSFWVMPFSVHQWGSAYAALSNSLRAVLLYAPLGAMVALAGGPRPDTAPAGVRGTLLIAVWTAGVVALLIELGQAAVAPRVCDVTDVLLGMFGAWLACSLTLAIGHTPQHDAAPFSASGRPPTERCARSDARSTRQGTSEGCPPIAPR